MSLQVRQHYLIFEPQVQLLFHVLPLALLALRSLQIPQILVLQEPDHIANDDCLIQRVYILQVLLEIPLPRNHLSILEQAGQLGPKFCIWDGRQGREGPNFGQVFGAFLEGQSADVPECIFEMLPLLLTEIFMLDLAAMLSRR